MTMFHLYKNVYQNYQKIISFLLGFSIFFPIFSSWTASTGPRIALTQIVQHPSLDKIRQGILDELREAGLIPGKNCEIVYENAQGNIAIAAQIAQKFAALEPAVIVAISTPSAQTVVQAVRSSAIPVVFSAITDPISAKLVQSLENTGGNITGTVDSPPAQEQLATILTLLPHLRTLAILFNPSEPNALQQVERMKRVSQAYNVRIIEASATKTAEVSIAARTAVEKADALFIPHDNTIVSALEGVLQVTDSLKIPVFTSDPESVERGALAATANDQYVVGRETGKVVLKILAHKNAHHIPVTVVSQVQTYINRQKASQLGIMLPASFNGKGLDAPSGKRLDMPSKLDIPSKKELDLPSKKICQP
jgi:putative ABC transport system substrate-binding protein